MMAETLAVLYAAALTCSVAIASGLLARALLRRRFGAAVAYSAWAAVPVVLVAVLLPARTGNRSW